METDTAPERNPLPFTREEYASRLAATPRRPRREQNPPAGLARGLE